MSCCGAKKPKPVDTSNVKNSNVKNSNVKSSRVNNSYVKSTRAYGADDYDPSYNIEKNDYVVTKAVKDFDKDKFDRE